MHPCGAVTRYLVDTRGKEGFSQWNKLKRKHFA